MLTPLERLGLLTDPTTVRWILDAARRVLSDGQRGIDPDYASISTERVAICLDDQQYENVRQLLDSERLTAGIALHQLTLATLDPPIDLAAG